MDDQALGITPVLKPISLVLGSISASLEDVKTSKEEFKLILEYVSELLQNLDMEYKSGSLNIATSSGAIGRLLRTMTRLSGFIQTELSKKLIPSLISKEKRLAALTTFEQELATAAGLLLISQPKLPHHETLQALAGQARKADQTALSAYLSNLELNQQFRFDSLDLPRQDQMAMLITLQKLESGVRSEEEHRFFFLCIQYLKASIGEKSDFTNWTFTVYDIDIGESIGTGFFGEVSHGRWGDRSVAVKSMRNGVIKPQISVIRPLITIWRRLLHKHVMMFLGANLSEENPFFVTNYMENSNVMNYINTNPKCDIVNILHQASLGLDYLHSQNVTHGNINGTNILIADDGSALLCDYDLVSIKDNISRRVLGDADAYSTNQNWMAPELFTGALFDKPCDIYSFGMTIYEVLTRQRPFANVPRDTLRNFVLQEGRPTRPSEERAPQLSDKMWMLAQNCWHQLPAQRPISGVLSALLASIHAPHDIHDSRPPAYLDLEVAGSEEPFEPYPPVTQSPKTPPSQPPFVTSKATLLTKAYTRCLTLKHRARITCLSSNQHDIVTGHEDGTVIVWDAVKGVVKSQVVRTGDNISHVMCFGAQSGIVATHKSVLNLYTWTGPAGAGIQHVADSTEIRAADGIQFLQLNSRRVKLLTEGDGRSAGREVHFNVFTSKFNMFRMVLRGHYKTGNIEVINEGKASVVGISSPPTCSAFLCEGKYLVTGDAFGSLFIWEAETGQPTRRPLKYSPALSSSSPAPAFPSGGAKCISIVPSPGSAEKFLVAYSTTEIRLWDTSSWTYTLIRPPDAHPLMTECTSLALAFSDDGSWVIYPSFSRPKCIEVYDLEINVSLTTCTLDDWPDDVNVKTIIMSPDRSRLILYFEGGNQVLIFCWPHSPSPTPAPKPPPVSKPANLPPLTHPPVLEKGGCCRIM